MKHCFEITDCKNAASRYILDILTHYFEKKNIYSSTVWLNIS